MNATPPTSSACSRRPRSSATNSPGELALARLRAMSSGDLALAAKVIHPEHINYMASDHPPASALPGLPGFMATSAWLRFAFADLTFEVMDVVSDGHRTIARVTMTSRQHGPFVVFPPWQPAVAFPPAGKPFAARQCHIFTIRDSQHGDHSAVRDDLAMMTQLGHLPPRPAAAVRMVRFASPADATARCATPYAPPSRPPTTPPHTRASPPRCADDPDQTSELSG